MMAAVDNIETDERISELAGILAVGLTRLTARKSSGISAHGGETSLDFSGCQSGDPTPMLGRDTDG